MQLSGFQWKLTASRRGSSARRLTCWYANKPKAFPLSLSRCALPAGGVRFRANLSLENALDTVPVDFLSVSVVDSGCTGSIIRSDGRRRDRGVNTRQKGERRERPRLGKHVAMCSRIKRDVSRKLPWPFCHVDRYRWVTKTAIRLFDKIVLYRASRLYRITLLVATSFVNARSIFILCDTHSLREKL